MNLYILEEVERCSDNYHDGGGLVIIAKDLRSAKLMIHCANQLRTSNDQSPLYMVTPTQWENARQMMLSGPTEPEIISFPNAGCC